ncbi:MAG TPA: hypothetical protein VJC16_02790 [Candidatus Nanoarchaeia archaeon]|nr:hypothetical protein [Candidatus Nanoarchaeia archaeon]
MMKRAILAMLLIFIGGCAAVQDPPSGPAPEISGTQDLVLDEQDLQQLGMAGDGTDCRTEGYPTNDRSPLAQYSFCSYTVNTLDDTQIVLELQKFTNREDLYGTYQYASLHLRGFEGLISEDDYGDQSRFYVSNESAVHYYHLWTSRDEYLIHITSKGSREAREHIAGMGRRILSRFG